MTAQSTRSRSRLLGERAAPLARARSSAAPTNSRKSGAGRVGRDLNSGWNCDATNHGCSGSSTISTSRPSSKVPLIDEAGVDELLAVGVVHLVAVPVALGDDRLCRRARARASPRRARPPARRGASSRRGPRRPSARGAGRSRGTASRDPSRSSSRRRGRRRGARTPRRRRACRGRCRGTGSRPRARRGRRGSSPPTRASRSRRGRARRRRPRARARASSSVMFSASTQRTSTSQPLWMPACLSASCTER